jgi:hypothetical protein
LGGKTTPYGVVLLVETYSHRLRKTLNPSLPSLTGWL